MHSDCEFTNTQRLQNSYQEVIFLGFSLLGKAFLSVNRRPLPNSRALRYRNSVVYRWQYYDNGQTAKRRTNRVMEAVRDRNSARFF